MFVYEVFIKRRYTVKNVYTGNKLLCTLTMRTVYSEKDYRHSKNDFEHIKLMILCTMTMHTKNKQVHTK